MLRSSLLALLLVAPGMGCTLLVNPDENMLGPDAGASGDSGVGDSGMGDTDAGTGDSGMSDSGTGDSGMSDSGTGDSGGDAFPECTGEPRCDGNVRVFCDADRVEARESCGDTRCEDGECVARRYRPANFERDIWDMVEGNLEITDPRVLDTDRCETSLATSNIIDGICVLAAERFTIREAGSLTMTGSLPVAFIVSGDVDISGTLDVSARGLVAGSGGAMGGGPEEDMGDGSGRTGGRAGTDRGMYDDGGGGGGGHCSRGGRGGDGNGAAGGDGGEDRADWSGEPLVGGSGGGVGPGFYSRMVPRDNVGRGGAGGGALQISTLASLTVTGSILAGGGGGDAGGNNLRADLDWGAGGGGGSGGSLVLEAEVFQLRGSLNVGGGGGGGGEGTGGDPSAGEDGAERLASAEGGRGGRDDRTGGAGAGADRAGGGNGGSTDSRGGNGGGGGGGGGCIELHTERPIEGEYRVAPRDAIQVRPRFDS